MYLDTKSRRNFARLSQPIQRLTPDDARFVAALLGGQDGADAAAAGQLGKIVAAACEAAEVPSGALRAATGKHGGRAVALALEASYSSAGRGPDDIMAAAAAMAGQGTGRLGPPLKMDGPVPSGPGDQDESGMTAWPQDGLRSPMEEAWKESGTLTPEQEARRAGLEASALSYATAGWRVHPLWWVDENGACACPKEPGTCKPGKHPILNHWDEAATCDPDVARWWWRERGDPYAPTESWYPLANIGVVQDPGRTFVLDQDDGGDATLEGIQERLGSDWDMPETLIVQTGSGGRHFYFLQPEGEPVGNLKLGGGGLEIKGEGGYVLAPPSVTDKGGYEIILDRPPARAPQWLLGMIGEHYKQQRGEPSAIPPEAVPTGKLRAYAGRVYARWRKQLADAGKGERNITLNQAAFALGQLCPAGITDEDTSWAVLSEAAAACHMREGVRATFLSGWSSGLAKPFWPDWAEDEDEDAGEWPLRTWDEFGLADRMVDRFGETSHWNPVSRGWMTWQSGRWEADAPEAGEWMARIVIESLTREEYRRYPAGAGEEDQDSLQASFLRFAGKQRTRKAMSATAGIARVHPLMQINPERCDADPMDINCRDGVYNGETEGFTGHSPDQLLTMRAEVSYDPEATCPRWDAFMEQVQPDPEMRAYLYRIWGYSMTGDTSEQAVFIHHGTGSNGKSVAQDVISSILGDYGQVVPVETLLTSRNKMGRIPNDVARTRGRRFLKASETHEGRRLDEAWLKSVTGGEMMVARFMRAEYFEFRPTGKIHLTSNFLSHVADDDAIWTRLHLIPWLVTIGEDRKNKHLAAELYAEEASGIFNRLLVGLADWRARGGLMPPAAAWKATGAYRQAEDTLGTAVSELYDIDMDHVECHRGCTHPARLGSQLYSAYQRWCRTGGMDPLGRTTYYLKLEKRGFVRQVYQRKVLFPQLEVSFEGLSG